MSENEEELWRLKTVLAKVGMSRSEWYRRMAGGVAPKPAYSSSGWTVWAKSDIVSYIQKIKNDSLKHKVAV